MISWRQGLTASIVVMTAFAFTIAATPVATATSHETTVDLLAGQNVDVGDVVISDDGTDLTVTYTTVEGWAMTETHLAVGDTVADVPQTKSGNPKVGQFADSTYHDPAVTEYTYTVPIPAGVTGDDVVVAAHAVVVEVDTTTLDVVSDTSWNVTAFNGASVTPYAAELAWVHPAWSQVDHTFSADAEWIWSSYRPDDTVNGDYVEFEKTLTLDGTPVDGHLYVTADNGYELWVNGDYVGNSSLLGDYTVDRSLNTVVTNYGWKDVELWDVSPYLVEGENTITIVGVNAALAGGTVDSNPAGVIVEGEIVVDEMGDEYETAWADGDRFTERGNWATYVTYELED